MDSPSGFNASSQWAFEHPHFLPLIGQPAKQALDLLMRKGAVLHPPLSKSDAQDILGFMSLEHFNAGNLIGFNAQDMDTGRLMLVISGEANIRMRSTPAGAGQSQFAPLQSQFSPLDRVQTQWFNVSQGATLGLIHAFSGLSSRFIAQVASEMLVASLTRAAFIAMKQQAPVLALRFLEMISLELALVALDHERRMVALSQVARSMQEHIAGESGETGPASLF
jgi:CRP-like cAMP-binding protein